MIERLVSFRSFCFVELLLRRFAMRISHVRIKVEIVEYFKIMVNCGRFTLSVTERGK